MINKIILFLVTFSIVNLFAQVEVIKSQKQYESSFAIVIDKDTYNRIENAVTEYRNSIENDGLSVFILINEWKSPDEIKSELIKLYHGQPKLEGAVFIGNIPIPMITKAQYMTTAFKLPEDNFPVNKTSVPSDRFYDDFDLKFQFIEQDSVNSLFYYYSLLPDSPQKIDREIYSARIKPPVEDETKYTLIENYLLKVAKLKSSENFIDNMLVYAGHGYNSESETSWADERLALREQFPQLYNTGGRLKNLRYDMGNDIKETLLKELEDKNLDIAIFHAHGSSDMQLIAEYPSGRNVAENIESVKLYLRGKLRSAKERGKDLEETKKYFMDGYDVPEDWFDGAFVDSVVTADSLLEYSLDIYSEDIDKISPQADFVIFDECFNGSFHKENYIGGKYVFGNGNVIVAEANSVNVLQDKWQDELLGLLNLGTRVGQWHKFTNYLESHIIGDPTYRFKTKSKIDINHLLNFESKNIGVWQEFLKSEVPALRELAVVMVYKNSGSAFKKELVEIYKNDPSFTVRLQALKCLAEIGGESFAEILKLSINDPYELIRRFTVVWMGEVGREEYLPLLIKQILDDESNRVNFNGKSAASYINSEKAIDVTNSIIENLPSIVSKEELKSSLINTFKRNIEWLNNEIIPNIENDTLKLKTRLREIRTFRNYKFQKAIPELILLAKNPAENEQVRSHILEVLAWFNLSEQKDEIILACKEVLNEKDVPALVKNEAVRTLGRLSAGFNNVITP